MTDPTPASAARHLVATAQRLGIDCLFTNLGSDHPAFIEAFASLQAEGRPMPRIVVCPHEMTALSAAHGYTMRTGRPQMVLVHVDVGTQNLGSSVHNAARGRIPVVLVAGLSPVSLDGSRPGARTETIHYTQDAPRQHEIVGQYMKWSYELRAGEMVQAVLLRALQIAGSGSPGPVYITGAREFWEEPGPAHDEQPTLWPITAPTGLQPDHVDTIHQALLTAKRPLIITTYLGRNPEAVGHLVTLAEKHGCGVIEISPQYLNFPGNHPQHLGYRRNTLVDQADLILLLDIDVPWIESRIQPADNGRFFHIDIDPIKPQFGFWHFPAELSVQADTAVALEQLAQCPASDASLRQPRLDWIADARSHQAAAAPPAAPTEVLTVADVGHAVRQILTERSVVLTEAPTANETLLNILRPTRPGSLLANGGSGLGWSPGAAVGVKLADPGAEVICLVGDGSYLFGIPGSTWWVSRQYEAPTLTVILNNGGWNAPKVSTLLVHPDGAARRNDTYWITTSDNARLADLAAAAGGAAVWRVSSEDELHAALDDAIAQVRAGRSAVIDAVITPISAQKLG